MCNVKPGPPPSLEDDEGITTAVGAQLRSRAQHYDWVRLWQALFPRDTKVPEPGEFKPRQNKQRKKTTNHNLLSRIIRIRTNSRTPRSRLRIQILPPRFPAPTPVNPRPASLRLESPIRQKRGTAPPRRRWHARTPVQRLCRDNVSEFPGQGCVV